MHICSKVELKISVNRFLFDRYTFDEIFPRSQSYQTFFFFDFQFLLFSLSVCNIRKNAFNTKWPSLIAKKTEKLCVNEEKKFGRIGSWIDLQRLFERLSKRMRERRGEMMIEWRSLFGHLVFIIFYCQTLKIAVVLS